MLPISGMDNMKSRHGLPSSTGSTPRTTSRRVSPSIQRFTYAFAFATLAVTASSASAPYIPTTILFPNSTPVDQSSPNAVNSGRAYIFSPNTDSGAIELLAFDLLASVSAESHPEPVPVGSDGKNKPPSFLADNKHTTFTPAILDNGNLAIIAGGDSCSNSKNEATLYTFSSTISSSASSPVSSGVWTSQPISAAVEASWDPSESTNPYFLTAAIQFTSQLEPERSDPVYYLYGGMCPFPEASSSSWQSSATYSNKMLRISSKDGSSLTLDVASSAGGPPVAEAGFTFTPLSPPSIANRSGIVTQQMSYVMLGGHTQSAFVNMSTAAVWSLPEESWTFVAIQDPSAASGSDKPEVDLAVKDAVPVASVGSRSGHTAVLSEDGSRLVIFGGWVGDFNQAAEPQLAVVEIGANPDEWRWSVPNVKIDGGGGSQGVYGHGAVLLPGNVMMVYGGYDIPGASSTKSRRNSNNKRQASSQGVRFFNVTALQWQTEYTHPASSSSPSPGSPNNGNNYNDNDDDNNGNSNDNSSDSSDQSTISGSNLKNLGVGLGLGLGIPALIGLIGCFVCLRRRKLRRRAERDDALRGLAQGIPAGAYSHSRSRSHSNGDGDDDDDDDEMMQRNDPNSGIGFFPWNASTAQEWYTGGLDPYNATGSSGNGRRSLGYETLRGAGSKAPSGTTASGLYIPPMPPAPLMFGGIGGSSTSSSSNGSSRPRGSVARGLYQPTTGADYNAPIRSSRNRGIHPIYEELEDEEDDLEDGDLGKHPLSPDLDDEKDDPFLTPTKEMSGGLFPPPALGGNSSTSSGSRGSGSSSPEMMQAKGGTHKNSTPAVVTHQQQDPEVQGWVSDVDAADAVLTARISRHGSTTTTPPALKLAGHGGGNSGGGGGGGGGGPSTPTRQTGGRLSPTRRVSTRSAGGKAATGSEFDDARTGSNLSDRSAFSFIQGAERAHLRASFGGQPGSGTAGGGGGIGRSGSSSGSSAKTYSTAKSNFAAMQAEGPSLLLGGGGHSRKHSYQDQQHQYSPHEEEEDFYVPGSPSKSKPRRSWFGSLRRVFSGATPSGSPGSSARGDSPTHDGLLDGDSSGRLVGMGPDGRLLRRKQGREAWGDHPQGGDHHLEDDWDVEKAVEQRLVQIMFTVPKERLRVVNAEIEKDEEMAAVVVDPDRDSYVDSSASVAASGEEEKDEDRGFDERRKAKMSTEVARETKIASVPTTPRRPIPEPVPVPLPESDTAPPPLHRHDMNTIDPESSCCLSGTKEPARAEDRDLLTATSSGGHGEIGVSPSTSMRSMKSTSNATDTIHTAEAVRLERPRTRVLAMVETFESKSRDNSPSGSPTRSIN